MSRTTQTVLGFMLVGWVLQEFIVLSMTATGGPGALRWMYLPHQLHWVLTALGQNVLKLFSVSGFAGPFLFNMVPLGFSGFAYSRALRLLTHRGWHHRALRLLLGAVMTLIVVLAYLALMRVWRNVYTIRPLTAARAQHFVVAALFSSQLIILTAAGALCALIFPLGSRQSRSD
jgi:hypothetical protein